MQQICDRRTPLQSMLYLRSRRRFLYPQCPRHDKHTITLVRQPSAQYLHFAHGSSFHEATYDMSKTPTTTFRSPLEPGLGPCILYNEPHHVRSSTARKSASHSGQTPQYLHDIAAYRTRTHLVGAAVPDRRGPQDYSPCVQVCAVTVHSSPTPFRV